jgi:hypothetical protein
VGIDRSERHRRTLLFDDTSEQMTGRHKIAFTRTNAKAVRCIGGNPIRPDAIGSTNCVLPMPGFAMVNLYLGGWDTVFLLPTA